MSLTLTPPSLCSLRGADPTFLLRCILFAYVFHFSSEPVDGDNKIIAYDSQSDGDLYQPRSRRHTDEIVERIHHVPCGGQGDAPLHLSCGAKAFLSHQAAAFVSVLRGRRSTLS